MLIHSQHNNNNNSTLPTVSAELNLDDTKRTSLIKSSTDDISKTIESNSRISFNSNTQNTLMIPENSSNNENLLDDATIGHILNMLDTIGLDQNQESDSLLIQSSKLDSGYAEVSDEKLFTLDENSQDFIVNNDDKTYTPRRTKSSLSRKRSIRQKSLDNTLSRTSTMDKNSFSEISEENLKESAGTDNTSHSLNSTKRAKSVKSLRKSLKNSDQDKNNSSLSEDKLSTPSTDNNNNNQNKTCDERNDESKKVVNNENMGYSNFYLAMPNGKWRVRTRTASRKITGTHFIDIHCI
ncbi:hypothetical protein C2G38_2044089 [Gigaspora rosea]|uniref:Uncharacterized protein n=1 Tax=Gigaspora rosea TaxID=44941 RepID=A0A397UKS4_9GLOM|nr:hypothetical protein C2G38_2044089 [Gigaspora rosea]